MATDIETPAEPWHQASVAETAARLATDLDRGLSLDEAEARLARYGANAIPEATQRGWVSMLLGQFLDLMILILIAAAVISGIVGDVKDTIIILVIVVLNGVVGFIQEFRAARAVAALRRMTAPHATAIRAGHAVTLDASDLVPGDIVTIEAGNAVPADLRLVEAANLKIGEAALTGESLPVEKMVAPLDEPRLPIGDRRNLAFKGTIALNGRGRGIVVATGSATELGKIAGLLQGVPDLRTPLQQRLAAFGRQLSFAILGVCAIVFAAGLLRGEEPLLMLLTAVSLAVAAIPEALPAVVTVLLALGAAKMARQRALIRRLPAVETLGSVTYICSDKTGTLTQNQMAAIEVRTGAERDALSHLGSATELGRDLYTAMALCNDVTPDETGTPLGDPTEVALWQAAAAAGIDKHTLEAAMPRMMEVPFDSDRKRMTTIHRDADGFIAFTKGSPESVLERCTHERMSDGERPLDRADAMTAAERMAADGLRVLAVASRRWPSLPSDRDAAAIETGLTLLGLVGLIDPPRAEAREAVALCQTAGIVPVMITGDHPATARAIARQLGIADDGDDVLTGQELHDVDDPELARRVLATRVYARVDPAQKIRIVSALQGQGQFVAMTGDGVNDAPALARADIGVAMGKGGTDVAREAASLVLLDDNFATIVAAVGEGRRIYDNIRKFVRYTLTSNSAEIWTIFLAPFLGMPVPLLPVQILWINLVTDGLPGLALAVEPAERDVMQRPPRPPRQSIFAHGLWQQAVWVGLAMGGLTLVIQAYAIHIGDAHWQTMVFTTLTLVQMGNVMAIRSERDSLFAQGLWSNRALLGAVVLTVVLQLATVYVPVLNPIFNTAPLTPFELFLCLLAPVVVFALVEAEKFLTRRGVLYRGFASGRSG